jgi:hypothetical protein
MGWWECAGKVLGHLKNSRGLQWPAAYAAGVTSGAKVTKDVLSQLYYTLTTSHSGVKACKNSLYSLSPVYMDGDRPDSVLEAQAARTES